MKTVLFVCTGNTCRSPMAQVMMQQMLRDEDIGEDKVKVISAGLYAGNGEQASTQAVQAMKKRGLSLEAHRSRRLTPRMIDESFLILGMTEEHKQAVMMLDAAACDKVFSLGQYAANPEDESRQQVPDPFGQSVAVYEKTADILATLLLKVVQKLKEERKVEGQ